MEHESDKQVLQRVARGDKYAMRVIYMRHQNSLHGFLMSRGSDVDGARDIIQEAMLELWGAAGQYRGDSSVRTWLFAIARNKFVDHVRRSSRLSYVEEVPERIDRAPDAEAVVEASQDADRMRACLKELKKTQLTVIHLAFFEGLTYQEIAKIEGIPLGTVKSRIFHAKQALMHSLSKA